jgi:hypothetical protein
MSTKREGYLQTPILLIAASALALVLIACGQHTASQGAATGNAGGTTAAATKAGAAKTAALGGNDAQTAISNAKQLLQTQPAYRVLTTSTTSMGGEPSNGLREFVAPDRMHIVEREREIIIIGKTMYVKRGGAWRNMGTQMSDMAEKMNGDIRNMSAEERAQALKGVSGDYRSLGDEMLGGTSTATYELRGRVDTQVEGIGAITTITKYWIGKDDGLIRKEESGGDEAGAKTKTTRIYEYDPDIKIEAPIS